MNTVSVATLRDYGGVRGAQIVACFEAAAGRRGVEPRRPLN